MPDEKYDDESNSGKLEKIKNVVTGITGAASIGGGITTANPLLIMTGAASLFGSLIGPLLSERREVWYQELKDAFEKLETKVNGFNFEESIIQDKVVDALIQATLIAIKTSETEKRELLRNAILNISQKINIDKDMQTTYLQLIDELTPTHIKILTYFENPEKILEEKGIGLEGVTMTGSTYFLEKAYPEIKGKYGQFLRDLGNRGLLPSGEWYNVSGSNFLTARSTLMGKEFLRLIRSPIN